MTWNRIAKGMRVIPGSLPGDISVKKKNKYPKRVGGTRDYTLTDGSVVNTASCVTDPRNVYGLKKSSFFKRLRDKRMRDPKEVFAGRKQPLKEKKNGADSDSD